MRELTSSELHQISGGVALTIDVAGVISARFPDAAQFALAMPEFNRPSRTGFQSVFDAFEDSLESALGLTKPNGKPLA